MTRARTEIVARLRSLRGMPAPEASAYLGLGETKFHEMVADGRMPRPRIADGKRLWDVDELDVAFKNLPREGGERPTDSWADFRDGSHAAPVRRAV